MAEGAEQKVPPFRIEGAGIVASTGAAGPWNSGLQHGGAPSALLAWAAERVPAARPMQIARMTVELMRPVPLGALSYRTEIVRDGRQIQVVQASLEADGKEVVRAHVLRIRAEAVDVAPSPDRPEVPAPEECPLVPSFMNSGFGRNMEVRAARGSVRRGPSAAWFKIVNPLIEGQPILPVMRAMATADFGNGISMTLDMNNHSFINAEVSVHLLRQPVGEWILLDAQTLRGNAGRGLTQSRLADVHGYIGVANQSLVIAKREAGPRT